MKFDFIIGNPPYQDETIGDNKEFAPPIYHLFIDESYKLANKVELIHPARFLFNAGSTPKAWNIRMLNDPHFKILFHEHDSSRVFPNTDIMGGIVVSYHDNEKDFGAIETYTVFNELNTIIHKAAKKKEDSMMSIVFSAYSNHFTKKLHEDYPEIKYNEKNGINTGVLSKGHDFDLKSNVIEKLPQVFIDSPENTNRYIVVYGLLNGVRTKKYIKSEYIAGAKNLESYKVLLPAANGSGAIGEVPLTPLIGDPFIGNPYSIGTETFISVGSFNNEKEACAALKYIKSKFARCLLGVLKVTQHVTPEKWKYVPLQDFTLNSDIDWSKNIKGIDQQLYLKYNLNDEEIDFIETHIKEME